MNKGFIEDTFEKAVEAGQSMAKGGAKQIKQTFNPLQMIRTPAKEGQQEQNNDPLKKEAEKLGREKGGSTPLDFEKLQKSYGNQDEAKAKALASRLFQMVKSGEEKVHLQKKQEEEEKKRRETLMEQEKKRKEAEKQNAQQDGALPTGKERKSIMGGKKKKSGSTPAPTEIRPSKGKH